MPPCVNQVERHPLLPQWSLLDYCSRVGVLLQAHTPLAHGHNALLKHPAVRAVAAESGLSVAQVLLQWNLRHGVAVVPKCSSAAHAAECLAAAPPAAAALTGGQMQALDGICAPGGRVHRVVAPPFMTRPEAVRAGYGWRADDGGWGSGD